MFEDVQRSYEVVQESTPTAYGEVEYSGMFFIS